jgi:hypothetical protein
MQGAVVDDGIAGFGQAEDLVDDVVAFGEDIQPKRMRVAVYPLDQASVSPPLRCQMRPTF